MSSLHLLRPGWLLALPPLLILLVWLWRGQPGSRSWQAVCDPELLPHLLLGRSQRRARRPFRLLLIGLLLAVLALAGPAWRKQPQPLFRQQSALVILLDLSRSMAAADLKPSRLERARLKVEDLLRQRREGQTALIAVAGDAFVVTPLTDDVRTIGALLESLDPELMPVQGSEPQRAIQLGVELLRQAGLQRGRLLLITDEDRPARVLDAAGQLRQAGFELAVLGVGTDAGAPIPLAGGGFLKDVLGNLVLPKLDEAGLQQLAAAGGGNYRRLTIDDSDLRGVLAEVDEHRLDRAEKDTGKTGVRWRDEGVWLLWPLALLAALAFRRGWLALAVLLLLPLPAQAFSWQDLWQRPEQRAAGAFAAGDYDRAQQLFRDPRWKAGALYRAGRYQAAVEALEPPESADDWYNRGNALARDGQLPPAAQAYREALRLNPDHADARTNKELVEDVLRQQQQQEQQQKDQQKSGDQKNDQQQQQDSGGQNGDKQKQEKQNSPGADQSDARQQKNSGQASQAQAGNVSQARQGQKAEASATPRDQAQTPQEQDQSAEQFNPATAQPRQRATGGPDQKSPPPFDATAEPGEEPPAGEQERAVRQWLQRIPDDPGGLLRRKFLYQYRQRGRQLETDRPW